jgi:GDPmannose 4,6-dehydratase
MKKALITGVTGQDGSYLAEYLLGLGYEVHGVVRPSSRVATNDAAGAAPASTRPEQNVHLHAGDVLDQGFMTRLITNVEPDEVYNLAAQSHVGISFSMPSYTTQVTGQSVLHLLEIIRRSDRPIRFYQASSSEMFGNAESETQNESTPLRPASPYAAAKVFAHDAVSVYRSAYGLHASSGILFNHESPRRSDAFVTRKVTKAVAEIVAGSRTTLALGNLEAARDWGYAPEYVHAMHTMLQQETSGDYVIATGETHSVMQLCELAFSLVGLDWRQHVTSTSDLFRPSEVHSLKGDARKAARALGWTPTTRFRQLIGIMLNADLAALGISERVTNGE